jgi:hypothetical protein
MIERPLILQLDITGNPQRWITYENAAYYYCKELIAWSIGVDGYRIYGGVSKATGERSFLDFNTIIATKGEMGNKHLYKTPILTNRALFRRDHNICAYCGGEFTPDKLTRDHILPKSRGGKNRWENVVAACSSCNKLKDNRTPEEADMKLLYVPYAPVRAEYLLLMNRRILADQMEFLLTKIPRHSRAHKLKLS